MVPRQPERGRNERPREAFPLLCATSSFDACAYAGLLVKSCPTRDWHLS